MKKHLSALAIFFSIFCYTENTPVSNYNTFFRNITTEINKEHTKKLCYSPFSIRQCLLMTMLGANTQTYLEFVKTLYPKAFEKEILGSNYANNRPHGFNLFSKSKIFVNENENLKELFCHHSRYFFQANPEKLNFSLPKDSSQKINEWITESTKDHIKGLVTPSDITEDLRLLVLNTLYFEGLWIYPFDENFTRKKNFYFGEETKLIPFMTQETNAFFYEDHNNKMLSLPFQKHKDQPEVSLVIFLPKEQTLVPLQKAMPYFTNMESRPLRPYKIHIEIPKISFVSSFSLNKPLITLGLKLAFSKDADFSRMNGQKNLSIGKILHKCKIDLNETGLTASSATGAFLNLKSAIVDKPPERNFIANKPFAFMIFDSTHNTCLFAGQYFPS